jgi:hypothetical protein
VLQLHDLDLSATIPTSLGNLKSLYVLAIYDMPGLTGTIPTEIGQISLAGNPSNISVTDELKRWGYVSTFGLPSNNLSGTIPTELARMEACQLINLERNQFQGELPSELGLLTSLHV